jgi:GrpB-like predicted nucleotidyltransferase (UPF0157 family)
MTVIVAYDPRWPALFEEERARLLASIGTLLAAIEHVGSTVVPGLAANPIIDMMGGSAGTGGGHTLCRSPRGNRIRIRAAV